MKFYPSKSFLMHLFNFQSLLDLHQVIMMIEHCGKMGPLAQVTVKREVAKLGYPCWTLEEIILHKASTFGDILPKLDLIEAAAFGSDPVKRSISDFTRTASRPWDLCLGLGQFSTTRRNAAR